MGSKEADSSRVKYNIEFTFDCDCPSVITVYYFAVEKIYSNTGLRYECVLGVGGVQSRCYYFEAGANQVFSQPELIFDPCAFTPEQLQCQPISDVFPVVIHCVCNQSNEDVHGPPQSHSTLAVVEKSAEGHGFILKPLKQKLYIDGVCYLLQEIYGIENKNANSSENGSKSCVWQDEFDDGAECVVCMSDLRDTLILPCRHLCLCNACAETLRYKASNCPICRSPFRALLQIKTLRRLKSTTSAPILSSAASAAVSASAETMTTKFSSKRNESEEFLHPLPPPLQGTFLTTRYESIPLVEALNGPVDHTQTCVTLPAAPILPVSHSAPTITASARSPSGRVQGRSSGRHKKKHSKPVVPIQEVLTPQSIGGASSSLSSREKGYSPDAKRSPYVTGFAIPTLSEETGEEETEFGAGSPQIGRVTKIMIGEDRSDTEEGVSDDLPSKSVPTTVSSGGSILVHSSSSGALDSGRTETPRSALSASSVSSTKPLLPDSGPEPNHTAEC